MKDKKYYTPEISEFHVGFEFQDKNYPENDNAWTGRPYTLRAEYELDTVQDRIDKNQIRVKHLDREDIESLGWRFFDWRDLKKTTGQYVEIYEIEFNKNKYSARYYQLTTDSKNNTIDIIERDGRDGNVTRVLFKGTIKNKSELKTLLKWLKIN